MTPRGHMTEVIRLQLPTTVRDGTGQVLQNWEQPAKDVPVRASAVQKASRRWERLSALFQAMDAAYVMAGPYPVTSQHRVSHVGRSMTIIGILTDNNLPADKAREITLICSGIQR